MNNIVTVKDMSSDVTAMIVATFGSVERFARIVIDKENTRV